MNIKFAGLAACLVLGGIAFGATPAYATLDPYHPGIVILGACPEYETGNTSQWVDYDNHHAISITSVDGYAGFEVIGNVSSILHDVLPGNSRGPIPPGTLSFRVASQTKGATYTIWVFSNNNCAISVEEGVAPVNGVVTAKIGTSLTPGGLYAGEVQVFLGVPGTVDNLRAIVGDVQINGVALPGSTMTDSADTYPGVSFCSYGEFEGCDEPDQ